MNDIVEELKARYIYIKEKQSLNEETVKINLIRDVFLSRLGFDLLECTYEKPCRAGYADIVVHINEENLFFIETKKGLEKLKDIDIGQLAGYIQSHGMEWGLLTNGKEYVLINTTIPLRKNLAGLSGKEQIVFWFNIFDNKTKVYTKHEFFKYLSRENIYENRTTKFFKDIADFKSLKYYDDSASWYNYRSTLLSFFDYYSNVKRRYRDKSSLEEITIGDFQDYIYFKQKSNPQKLIATQNAINSNYSHLSSMLNTLKDHGIIGSTHLDKQRKTQLSDMVFEKSNKIENNIGSEMISAAITYYKEKDKDIAKLAAFLLCASIGLERKQIHNLKWQNVDLKKNYLLIDERKVPISPILKKCFETMYEEKKSKKIKIDYVFTSFYGGKYKQVAENFINTACNQLQEIDDGNEKWSLLSPEYLRRCLIANMFEAGYSIEEIIYLTGIDIKNIFKYIDNEKIIEKQSNRVNRFSYKKLYDGIFENV